MFLSLGVLVVDSQVALILVFLPIPVVGIIRAKNISRVTGFILLITRIFFFYFLFPGNTFLQKKMHTRIFEIFKTLIPTILAHHANDSVIRYVEKKVFEGQWGLDHIFHSEVVCTPSQSPR